MARRPRILYLTQIFEPEGVLKGLSFASGLRDAGFDVEVATAFPNYPLGRIYPGYKQRPWKREVMNDIPVFRLPIYPSRDRSGFRRSLTYLSFFLSCFIFCLIRGRRYDLIYVYHPPMTVSLAAALSGVVTRTPFVPDIQDLWPESVTASGMAGGRTARILDRMCNYVYRRAAAIVVQSRGMKVRIAERGVSGDKIRTIYNWTEEGQIAPCGRLELEPYGFEGRFTFVFGGSMGSHQALEAVVRAAVLAAERVPAIQLLLIGHGLEKPRLAQLASAIGPQVVRLMPPVNPLDIADVFARANVLLVHLADLDFFRVTIPSKTQFYLASGKPILCGVAGEASEIITEAGAGLVAPPEDVEAIASCMVQLATMQSDELAAMGERGRSFYARTLSQEEGVRKTAELLHEVIAGSAA